MTDGEENASKDFSANSIKKLVEELKEKRWTFTYIGTDHDVEKIASSLSINNTMMFEKNEEDIKSMFFKEQNARANYSKKISQNEETSSNYFEDENENNTGITNPEHPISTQKTKRSLWQKLFGSK